MVLIVYHVASVTFDQPASFLFWFGLKIPTNGTVECDNADGFVLFFSFLHNCFHFYARLSDYVVTF